MSKSFTLVKEQQIPEINSLVQLYEHKRTGARLLSVVNDDENKVFSINFRTPPKDSTGVAHILEHSVLGGSEKYPVKEPFVELVKGSLATFINAFTYPDKTCYPVASQNEKDFYNLIDVYMDAVLHPRITEQTLMQEGWHYEVEENALAYKGVVFNEMKGAYSSPDNLLGRTIQQSLFPKHTYGVDSGGDPANIPDLTYENFRAFWESYYHPSNAFIFFYGNDDPEKRLKLMEGYLKPYKRRKVKSSIPLVKPFKKPKKVEYSYSASAGEDLDKKHYLTVNWKLPDTSDPALTLSLQILSHALIDTPASPLRKALMDSGLGEDLAGNGLETELREMFFSTGLKGTRARHAKKIETLIFDTLQTIVKDGFDPDMTAASLNTIEFALRENNTGSFPRGIALMLRALAVWLYDDDPFKTLAFEASLADIKNRLTNDSRYFEKLIQTHLLENNHRTTLRFKPDPELSQRLQAEETSRLDSAKAAMSESDIKRHAENAKRLKQLQETPDSAEALATIPTLELNDLDKQIRAIPIEEIQVQDGKVLYHDLFTNGIFYLDLAFDLRAMPLDLLPLTEVFARALFEMGTETEDYVKLSQRIGKSTGGIHGSSVSLTTVPAKEARAMLMIRGKSTVAQSREMLNILRDILLTVKFDNKERLKQIVLEEKSGVESALAPAGHRFANMRLRAQFGGAGWVNDQTRGVGYLFALRELANEIDKDWKKVLSKMETMRESLINCKTLIANVTLDATNWKSIRPHLENFIFALPVKDAQLSPFDIQTAIQKEGLAIPAQVNYVGKGANLYDLGYEYDGSSAVVIGYLGMTHLWEKIRVQGGAYGAFAQFDDATGIFTYLSYRDPNVDETIKNYDAAPGFLKSLESSRLSDNELKKAVISTIGELDAYQLPDAKGYTSMMRRLTGRTDEMRQKIRDQVLSANGEDFLAFGEALEKAIDSEAIVVVGSQSALEGSKEKLKITKVA
ncbi:MAG: peptidase M16 [Chloroflexi bacterium CFX1]|nr:peptidase M16 [Chloroflexi bacterium CFX1]MCQ3953752.1 peptidase M16 [Chloroflexota bacterium]MDL1920359.1 peptidase M16 [Chloroflexi bacterium CFX5]NUQ60268.1 insulinase family protein [Anaerolineales bacterium]